MSRGYICYSPLLGGGAANSVLPNTLAGFKGHFETKKKSGKWKKGREKRRKQKNGRKYPPPKNLVTALRVFCTYIYIR